jgi:omega-amidase
MKITLCQFDLKWLDKYHNLDYVKNVIDKNRDSDLIVFPEMFNTAYIMKPEDGAEDVSDSSTIKEIQSMLKDTNIIVAGSIPTVEDGKYYNSFVFVSKEKIEFKYDKIHLFKMAGEGKAYSAGEASHLFECRGVKIRPLICYDLRFPYLSFQDKDNHHDLLIYTANWPVRRIAHWRTLLQARAVENQCYVIGVNRVGDDQNNLSYDGNSLAIDYSGKIIADLENTEGYKTIDINLADKQDYRTKLPFLKDAIL